MAKKSSGNRNSKTKSFPIETPAGMVSDKIEDAEVVAQDAVADTAEDAVETVEESIDATSDVVDEVSTPEVDVQDDVPASDVEPIEENGEESTSSEPEPERKPFVAADEPQKGGGFLPLLLGGLVAGGIGYGFAYFQNGSDGDDLTAQFAAQDEKIAALGSDMGTLATADAVADLNAAIAANGTEITALGERIDTSFTELEERVAVIERQPSADGTLQETALAAFESDIAALRDQIVAQQEELSEVLSSTREEAQAIESSAIASARAATARASLAVIQGALESGAPFGNALTDLGGSLDEPVPAALEAVAADGVPTLAAIQEMYPDAARAALNIARSEGASGEETSGLGSFLRNQLDVRSVEPQEGDSADAVLSRTEAALKEGR